MPFETLKKSHLKRNIIIGVLIVGIIAAIILNFTRAKYRVTESIPLVNGTINYSPGDIIISAYFNGELLETFPTKNDGYAVETVTCDKGASATFDEEEWKVKIDDLVTKGTKCNITFVEKVSAKDTILANYPTVLTRTDFTTLVTDTTTGTIYKSHDSSQYDNDGEVYYFAGNPTDNWVEFGGYWWHIIRINGDGTIRMIYQGTSANTTGGGTQTGTSSFNSEYDASHLVGYTYTEYQQRPASPNSGIDSVIKKYLEEWYNSHLLSFENSIASSSFCNDRNVGKDSTWKPAGNGVVYAFREREENSSPTFKCQNQNDIYTLKIGLLIGDEAIFAGATFGQYNQQYYLYTRQDYWTMSPYYVNNGGNAGNAYIANHGNVSRTLVNDSLGVRPVINLKADIKLTGSGTTTDPYRVEGA